ncbi:MAG: hypothetical protein GF331_22590 [Chitinivibrionales bacterium]|nr:hypothetical protein [Chitinivibrionales bacterium]
MNHKPQHRRLLASILLAALADANAAIDSAVYRLRLDASNTIVYDCERPGRGTRASWLVMGDPLAHFPHGHLDSANAGPDTVLGMMSGRLGSEIGDPLLNLIDAPDLPNRDHAVTALGAVRFPRIGLSVYGAYRYLDVYSDRFDTLWQRYRSATGHQQWGMNHDGADGLRDEQIAGYRVNLTHIRAEGKLQRYSCWGATPYFFSPVRYAGYRTSHAAHLAVSRFHMAVQARIDAQDRYTTAPKPSEFSHTELAASAGWSYSPNGHIHVRSTYDNAVRPTSVVAACLSDSGLGPFSAQVQAGVTGDGDPQGRLALAARLGLAVTVSADLECAVRPRPEPIQFDYLDTLVRCTGEPSRSTAIHLSVAIEDTGVLPLTARLWCDHIDRPVWQSIRRGPDGVVTIAECASPAGPLNTAGGRLSYHVHGAIAGADMYASGHITLGDSKEWRSVPWHAGVRAYLRSKRTERLRAEVTLDAAGPTTQRYLSLPTRSIEERRSPTRVSLWVRGQVPVVSPFLRRRLRLSLSAEIGPIGLTGARRAREHPNGNLMGPRVEVQGQALLCRAARATPERPARPAPGSRAPF